MENGTRNRNPIVSALVGGLYGGPKDSRDTSKDDDEDDNGKVSFRDKDNPSLPWSKRKA